MMSLLDRLLKPSKDSYARKLLGALRSLGDLRQWNYDKAGFRLEAQGQSKGSTVINLGTIYAEFCQTPRKERNNILLRTAMMSLSEIPATFEAAKSSLMPAIKHGDERGMIMIDTGPEHSMLFQPLCGQLETTVVHDTEHGMSRLSEKQLAEWGVSREQLLSAAMDNLRARSDEPMQRISPGLYLSNWQDYLDASRMLLTDLLYRHAIGGTPVVMVPNRTCLLLAGDQDLPALTRMLEIATEVLQDPRPLSPQMMRWEKDHWAEFSPPELADSLFRLRFDDIANSYAVQKKLMDEMHERKGIDIFVASFMAFSNSQSDRPFSVATWTEGVHALLPVTDSVILGRQGSSDMLTVGWNDLLRVCSDLMRRTADMPARYEVTTYPDESRLKELATCRVEM